MILRAPQRLFPYLLATGFLLAHQVLARAGGGQSFSGGGGGGGGGFSGGGGGGDGGAAVELLIALVLHYPAIGVPVVLVVGVVVLVGAAQGAKSSGGDARISSRIRRNNLCQHELARDHHLEQIRTRDPEFDSAALVARAKTAFEKIQESWSDMTLDEVRAFVSDGVYERFSLQLAMLREANRRNVIDGLSVQKSEIVAVRCDEQFDCIHLRFRATAIDYTIDFDDNTIVAGDRKTPQPFTEYWTFLRKPGAKTLDRPGLMEGHCPSCGAPQSMTDKTVCEYCSAVINSGEYDWVLSEITQEIVWDAESATELPPGVADLRATDAGFSVEHIEDRTSAIFWRVRASEFFRDLNYVKKVGDADFVESTGKELAENEGEVRTWYADAAVGAVELLQVSHDDDGYDRASVRLRWSGAKLTNAEIEHITSPDEPTFMQESFVLKRKHGVQSTAKNQLASCHCPTCGAPETLDNSDVCAYCDTPLNDGAHGWVLDTVEPYYGRRRKRQVNSVPRQSLAKATVADEEVVSCAIALMYADGKVDHREEMQLHKFAKARNLPPARLQAMINTVLANDGATIPVPSNTDDFDELIGDLVRICLADGVVDENEHAMLRMLGERINYSDYDLEQVIKRERGEMHREARDAKFGRVVL
jgi:uncharacterized tellurite resistance protein B-like protein